MKRALTNAERQKKYRSKAKMSTIYVKVPVTDGEKREERPHQSFSDCVIVKDENKRTIIWFKKGKLSLAHTRDLYWSTKKLENDLPPEEKYTCRASPERTHHVGCWRKYQEAVNLTTTTRETAAVTWIQENRDLFTTLASHFKAAFPTLYESYISVGDLPIRLGAWSTCAINFNYGCIKSHKDKHDYRKGLCWVVTCGNYKGGQLHFKDLNLTIEIQPGDIIAFRSYELEHEVLEYTGDRYSIVMFQSHDMFFDAE